MKKLACNLGCGNQYFESTKYIDWKNLDLNDRDGKIDIECDVSKKLPFDNETFDIMVASHIVEHIEMSIVKDVIKDWMRCLKKDGTLYITVPNARSLAERFVTKDIDLYTFAVNMTGPYHSSVADHHRWCYDYDELTSKCEGYEYGMLDSIPHELDGKLALDWWILGIKVKHL